MPKVVIGIMLMVFTCAAQNDTKENGYHIVHPKNTGPTPEARKEQPKDKGGREKEEHGLDTGKPQPTLQPEVAPPQKP